MPIAGKRPPLLIDADRIAQHLSGELPNRRRHRGAEEHRLAFRRQMAEYAPDVRQEPHVEHAIGFVENQTLQPGELRVRRPKMIEQPSRRRDEDVDAAAKRVLLRAHPDSAKNSRAGNRV